MKQGLICFFAFFIMNWSASALATNWMKIVGGKSNFASSEECQKAVTSLKYGFLRTKPTAHTVRYRGVCTGSQLQSNYSVRKRSFLNRNSVIAISIKWLSEDACRTFIKNLQHVDGTGIKAYFPSKDICKPHRTTLTESSFIISFII